MPVTERVALACQFHVDLAELSVPILVCGGVDQAVVVLTSLKALLESAGQVVDAYKCLSTGLSGDLLRAAAKVLTAITPSLT